MKYCCDKMKDAILERNIERNDENNKFDVNGCCGGCYIIYDMEFCPWCGSKLE